MKNIIILLSLFAIVGLSSCDKDDPITPPVVNIGMDQSTTIESVVTLDGSAMNNDGDIAWAVTAPDGSAVILSDASAMNPTFTATQVGQYMTSVTATNAGGITSADGVITVSNVTYNNRDQMGRPAINTVFNFFGDADTKNGYNQTLPSEGSANAAAFKGIFDALQGYIGLKPDEFINILGIGNEATAGVLAVDVLGSDKTAGSAYGTLNGRALGDDVVDVTLILAFDDQSGNTSGLIDGLKSDNVNGNDKAFLNSFPYLAAPH